MAGKRSRATYETDLHAQLSPFVIFGTPLPRDPDLRDDGSYVPVWKQEVRDERGLKRLHGAFTGGFSAGYYNSVGSKEGWTPSAFISSRSNRKKDDPKLSQQKPEDFMDEEDLADAENARRVHTSEGFSGLGSTDDGNVRREAFIDLFRAKGETIGVKLLKRMGWKEGQGIGPKIWRKARLGNSDGPGGCLEDEHLFAPENTQMISLVKKNDHQGMGYEGQKNLRTQLIKKQSDAEDDEARELLATNETKKKPVRGGIGIGILNDTGSDDEDPYEAGPQISYNRVIRVDKKKKKKPINGAIDPLLTPKPVFISKKAVMAKASTGLRKCYDGRLPLDDFHLASQDNFFDIISCAAKYMPPPIPQGWVSSKQPTKALPKAMYLSTAERAKGSKLDPKSRASILGETLLPGKSVFDFLSPVSRDRIAAASGKRDLPKALGEVPKGYHMMTEGREKDLQTSIPKVDKYIADAALNRGANGFIPYGEDGAKRSRYLAYLENQAGITTSPLHQGSGVSADDWLKELREFANCAQIFKPISGMMATRFTSSTTAPILASDAPHAALSLVSKLVPKPKDPAEQAAKLGMYGPMTRSSKDWYPTRLLCKRFNVKPPAHVQPGATEHEDEAAAPRSKASDLVSQIAIDHMMAGSYHYKPDNNVVRATEAEAVPAEKLMDIVVDADRNDALEGQRAGEMVFKSIFGDDSGDED